MFRKKQSVAGLLLSFLFLAPSAMAQGTETQTLGISEAAIATAIEDLVPQGVSETFQSDVGKLYAFTRVSGAEGEEIIKHMWFYKDKLMTEIQLSVKSASWRTYSSKKILPQWTGQWKVEILDEDGRVLKTLQFMIE